MGTFVSSAWLLCKLKTFFSLKKYHRYFKATLFHHFSFFIFTFLKFSFDAPNLNINHKNPFYNLAIPQVGSDVADEGFKYSSILTTDINVCINRSEVNSEITRVFNKRQVIENKNAPHVLIIGSTTVLGSTLKSIFQKRNQRVLTTKGINEFDFSSEDTPLLFEGINIISAYITYQPPYVRHAHSDGSEYTNTIIHTYITGLCEFLRSREIPFIFATSQPLNNDTIITVLLNGGTVVKLPMLVDSLAFKDLENPTMRAVRECRKVGYSNIEYFSFTKYHSIDSITAAKYVIRALYKKPHKFIIVKGHSVATIKESVNAALKSLALTKCAVTFKKFPHKLKPLGITPQIIETLGKKKDNVIKMISKTYRTFNRKEKDKNYMTILTTGRHDSYSKNFEVRAQNFLNSISYGLKNVPLAQVEVIYVDYGTPRGTTLLFELCNISKYLNGHLRFIVVPPEVHKNLSIKFNRKGGFFEFVAKNIGLRRAKSKFVLTTNSDNMFSTHFFELIASHEFNSMMLYRANRWNERENTLEVYNITKKDFIKILPEVWKLEKMDLEEWTGLPPKQFSLLNTHFRFMWKHFSVNSASGDFLLLSWYMWERIRGFNEVPFNMHTDSLFVAKAMKMIQGIMVMFVRSPFVHQFHVSFNLGTEAVYDHENVIKEYSCIGTWRNCTLYCENTNWGFADHKFVEIVV